MEQELTKMIERAFKALRAKSEPYKTYTKYYDGDQPLIYTAERLKDAFDHPSVRFVQNWCAVVIDSVLDRLTFKGWDISDKTMDKIVDEFYLQSNMQKLSGDVHKNALVTSESFVVFDQIENDLRAFYNDSRMVHLFYDDNNPNKKTLGAKWWVDQDKKTTRLNIYTPELIYKLEAKDKTPGSEKAFTLMQPEEKNPFGEIPIIHYRTGYSELDNVILIQDAINKLFSDMMVVGEFNAFPMRYAVTNADLNILKNSPKTIAQIPKGVEGEENTQLGQFAAADLDKFLNAMDKLANSIAVITRTPKHYFHDVGGQISGEALIVMESPLIKKIKQIQENYAVGWQDCARFILKQSGREIQPSGVVCTWDPIETVQPLTKAQEIRQYVDMGVPLETMLRRSGWAVDEIKQMRSDQVEAKKAQASIAKATLELLRLQDARTNGADE